MYIYFLLAAIFEVHNSSLCLIHTLMFYKLEYNADYISFYYLGTYIFIETSRPRHKGDKAWLRSAVFRATGTSYQCFHFWYTMNGNSVGSLNVYLAINGTMTTVWTLSGNQGLPWQSAQFSFQSKTQYSVRICHTYIILYY